MQNKETTNYQNIIVEIISSNRKTSVMIIAEDKLIVNAPLTMSTETILSAISTKEKWINKQLTKTRYNVCFKWEENEKVYLFGKEYSLHLENANKSKVIIKQDKIEIQGPSLPAKQKAFREYQKELLEKEISKFEAELTYDVGSYTINYRYYKSRWGCCKQKERAITLNLWCASLPEEGIKYVFYHELAHLKVPNHQKEFYQHLEKLWKDYKIGLKSTKTYIIS